jgi:hypothetical protein
MHAYHTHVALHEAARVIAMLIETFRLEANAQITTQAPGIPTQRGDEPIVENPLPAFISTTLAEEPAPAITECGRGRDSPQY